MHEYMNHEASRLRTVEKLQKHVNVVACCTSNVYQIADHHMYKHRATEFASYLPRKQYIYIRRVLSLKYKGRIASLLRPKADSQLEESDMSHSDALPGIYIGILLKNGSRVPRKLISSIIKQFKQSSLYGSYILHLLMTNVRNDTPNSAILAASALAAEYASLPNVHVSVLADLSNFTYDETLFQRRSFGDNILLNLRQKIGLRREDDDGGNFMDVARVDPESEIFFTLDAADRLMNIFQEQARSAALLISRIIVILG